MFVLAVGLICGLGFVFLTPPLSGYDEPVHFLRADQVASGHLVASQHGKQYGGAFPATLTKDLRVLLSDGVFSRDRTKVFKHFGDAAPSGPKRFLDFSPSAVYSPVPYIPEALLMAVGHQFGASVLVLLYLGRIGSLLGTIGLLALAVARMPSRKWILATVALLPVTVLQASMLSADGVTIALALLVFALAFALAATPRGDVTKRQLVEIAIATTALGLAKPPYILFALLFAIPWWRHRGAVGHALVASTATGFAAFAAWNAYAASIYVAPRYPNGGADRFAVFTHVDPHRQERFIEHHPWTFVQTIQRTLSSYWHSFLHDVIAQAPLVSVPSWVIVAGAVILLAGAVLPTVAPRAVVRWRARVVIVATAALTFVALMALAYAGWNAVGAPRISAFQGRYLVPLAPLVLVALPARTRVLLADERGRVELLLAAASTVLLIAVGFWLRSHFY
jgi:uncharacterized membrane protein